MTARLSASRHAGNGRTVAPRLLSLQGGGPGGASVDRTKSVIILWMRGGPSQHRHVGPQAGRPGRDPRRVRPIATNVPGIQLTDLLPHDRRASWTSGRSSAACTTRRRRPLDGDQICFTGYPPGPTARQRHAQLRLDRAPAEAAPQPDAAGLRDDPADGARHRRRPTWASAYKPFETLADPAKPAPFGAQLRPAGGVTPEQLGDRRQLLTGFDRCPRRRRSGQMAAGQVPGPGLGHPDQHRRPATPSTSTGSRRPLRERYGFMPAFDPEDPEPLRRPELGQRMLLARRLVEAGVRLVTVDLRLVGHRTSRASSRCGAASCRAWTRPTRP